ncbi:MAG TPA: hypothetical protein DDX29_11190 [Clostridiales bacterium]|jgi:transposase-like protein|nr:hypothetical protein [Clostridiales bacterium]
MRKKRENYIPEEKVSILKAHLINETPVSEICDQHQLQPTVFYRWQQQLFENGAAAFPSEAKQYLSPPDGESCDQTLAK